MVSLQTTSIILRIRFFPLSSGYVSPSKAQTALGWLNVSVSVHIHIHPPLAFGLTGLSAPRSGPCAFPQYQHRRMGRARIHHLRFPNFRRREIQGFRAFHDPLSGVQRGNVLRAYSKSQGTFLFLMYLKIPLLIALLRVGVNRTTRRTHMPRLLSHLRRDQLASTTRIADPGKHCAVLSRLDDLRRYNVWQSYAHDGRVWPALLAARMQRHCHV